MEEKKNMVTVDFDYFCELVKNTETLNILINALEASAHLDYTEKELSYFGNELGPVVNAVAPNFYNRLINKLKKEKENEND